MATRRIVASEKTILEKDDNPGSSPAATEGSRVGPAVPTDVLVKLLAFTLAMVIAPIGSYFLTVNTVFRGNATYAGALAAIIANVVLVGYVIVAMREDQSEQQGGGTSEGKKDK